MTETTDDAAAIMRRMTALSAEPSRWCRLGGVRLRLRPLTPRQRTLRGRRLRNAVVWSQYQLDTDADVDLRAQTITPEAPDAR